MVQQVRGQTAGGVEDEDEDYLADDTEELDKEQVDKLLGSDNDDSGVDNDDVDTTLLDQSDDEEENTTIDDILQPAKERANKRPATTELVSSDEPKKKKRKRSQKCKVCGDKDHLKKDCEKLPEERRKEHLRLLTLDVRKERKR